MTDDTAASQPGGRGVGNRISEGTGIQLKLVATLIVLGIAGAVWATNINTKLDTLLTDRWSRSDMRVWALEANASNAGTSLPVPPRGDG